MRRGGAFVETITTVWSQLVADQHIFAALVSTAVGMNGSSRPWDDRSFDVMEQFDVAAHVMTHTRRIVVQRWRWGESAGSYTPFDER